MLSEISIVQIQNKGFSVNYLFEFENLKKI